MKNVQEEIIGDCAAVQFVFNLKIDKGVRISGENRSSGLPMKGCKASPGIT
jgi:hypothetical protein